MKKQSFVISAIILALGGFFAKGIGALYKIPLTNILGSSGLGLYYLVFPIYSLIIAISSNGLSVALTTEVAKCRKIRHRYNEQKLLRVALLLGFFISLIFAIMLLMFCKTFAISQGNINATMGYIAIAPAIILSTLIAILRGYFQGIENMIPTTVSMIIEQIVKLSFGLILAHKLCVYGIQYAVLGAIIGVTISEVIALVIIVINFIKYKGQLFYNYRNLNYKSKKYWHENKILKKQKKYLAVHDNKKHIYKSSNYQVRYSTKKALSILLKFAIPSTFSSIVIPIATMLDSFMIINILINSGYSSYVSTSLYGLSSGVVQTLISLPTIIIMAISTSMVPSLSGLLIKNDTNELKYRATFYIKITWLLSIIIFVIVYVFAEDIIKFLYGDGLGTSVLNEIYYATIMLKFSSVSIIYYAFLQCFTIILQTIGKTFLPFFALLLSLIVRTLLTYVMVANIRINIFGSIFANIIFLSVTTIILAICVKKYLNIQYDFFNHLLKPFICGVILLILGSVINWALSSIMHYILSMIISALLCLIIFTIVVIYGKVLSVRERKYIFVKSRVTKKDKLKK